MKDSNAKYASNYYKTQSLPARFAQLIVVSLVSQMKHGWWRKIDVLLKIAKVANFLNQHSISNPNSIPIKNQLKTLNYLV